MPWSGLALFAVGLVAGALNVVAGGGSFITLPMLIFMGLPPVVANATNRVGILVQNAGAVWGFHRHRVLPWEWGARVAVPALAGAGLGTWAALRIDDAAFQKILAFLMVAISLWTLLAPMEATGELRALTPGRKLAVAVSFFAVGIYGGFVQAGAGFLILAVTSYAGFDLVRGNALKVLTVLALTALSLGIFIWQDKVAWVPGLWLAAGTLLGGLVGVRLTVLKGHRWVRVVVTGAVIIFALKLWFD